MVMRLFESEQDRLDRESREGRDRQAQGNLAWSQQELARERRENPYAATLADYRSELPNPDTVNATAMRNPGQTQELPRGGTMRIMPEAPESPYQRMERQAVQAPRPMRLFEGDAMEEAGNNARAHDAAVLRIRSGPGGGEMNMAGPMQRRREMRLWLDNEAAAGRQAADRQAGRESAEGIVKTQAEAARYGADQARIGAEAQARATERGAMWGAAGSVAGREQGRPQVVPPGAATVGPDGRPVWTNEPKRFDAGMRESDVPGVFFFTDESGKTDVKDLREAQKAGRFDYRDYMMLKMQDAAAAQRYLDAAFGAPGGGAAGDGGPAVGSVRNGYRFNGGDPNQSDSWEKVR